MKILKNPTSKKFCSFVFFLCSFSNLFRQLSTDGFTLPPLFLSIFFFVGLGNAPFRWLLRFFSCEQSYSHYYFGKLVSQSRAAARQPDTINNFTTFEHLELIDEAQIFTSTGNREWPWQNLKVSLAKHHSPPMSNSEHLRTGYKYRWIIDMFSEVYNSQTSSFRTWINFIMFNTLTLCELHF